VSREIVRFTLFAARVLKDQDYGEFLNNGIVEKVNITVLKLSRWADSRTFSSVKKKGTVVRDFSTQFYGILGELSYILVINFSPLIKSFMILQGSRAMKSEKYFK
jgi:hypothetical protein